MMTTHWTVAPSIGAYRGELVPAVEVEAGLADHERQGSRCCPHRSADDVSTLPSSMHCPAIKRTALHSKHPRRSELTFERGEKDRPLVEIANHE